MDTTNDLKKQVWTRFVAAVNQWLRDNPDVSIYALSTQAKVHYGHFNETLKGKRISISQRTMTNVCNLIKADSGYVLTGKMTSYPTAEQDAVQSFEDERAHYEKLITDKDKKIGKLAQQVLEQQQLINSLRGKKKDGNGASNRVTKAK